MKPTEIFRAELSASSEWMCYVNADILPLSDFGSRVMTGMPSSKNQTWAREGLIQPQQWAEENSPSFTA
jgi:hypothetical protein